MGLRFRRRIQLFPGVQLNVTKTGLGISLGPRGLHYSVHSSGRRTVSAGLPGTGLYWSESWNHRIAKNSVAPVAPAGEDAATTVREFPPGQRQTEEALSSRNAHDGPIGLRRHPVNAASRALAAFEAAENDLGANPALRDEFRWLFSEATTIESELRASGGSAPTVAVLLVPGLALHLPLGRLAIGLALAERHQIEQDPSGALAVLDELPPNGATRLAQAELLHRIERHAEVVGLGEVDVVDDVTAMFSVLRASSLRQSHRLNEAAACIDDVLDTSGISTSIKAAALLERATGHIAIGRLVAARHDLAAALEAEPAAEDARRLMALTDTALEEPSAEAALLEAIGLEGDGLGARPDCEELAKRELELDSLDAEVIALVEETAKFETDLQSFLQEHDKSLGARYERLDWLRARRSGDPSAQTVEEIPDWSGAATAWNANDEDAPPANQHATDRPAPDVYLKVLYRRLAKELHPDRGANASDREVREGLMARLTQAWSSQDVDALDDVAIQARKLRRASADIREPNAESPGAELAQVISDIARRRRRLAREAERLHLLQTSPAAELLARAQAAAEEGRSLLQEMAQALDTDIQSLEDARAAAQDQSKERGTRT